MICNYPYLLHVGDACTTETTEAIHKGHTHGFSTADVSLPEAQQPCLPPFPQPSLALLPRHDLSPPAVNQRNRLRLLDKALEPKTLSEPEVCCVQSVISLSFAQRTATPASKLSSALTWMLGGSTSSTACRCPSQGRSAKRGSHVVGQEPLRNWLDFPGTESFPQRFLSLRGLGMAGCRLYYMVGRQRSRPRSRQRRRSRQRQRDGRVS